MIRRLIRGLAVLAVAATPAAAQQPGAAPRDSQAGMGAGGGMSMMMMTDSLNQRLDSLVTRMNRTSGNKKVDAMAAVINELVAQRKMMMSRMHQMMGGMMNLNMPGGAPAPAPSARGTADSTAADTTDHAAHHPPQ